MRFPPCLTSTVATLLIGASASAVTMDWTPIGNPGNACDPQPNAGPPFCFGAVNHQYSIGTYEVTNAQYAEFLNAKAAADPFGLYDPDMATVVPGAPGTGYGGIARSGVSGNYSYSAIAGRESWPVNYVSFYDTLRFANWLHNGQGAGDTETGSYTVPFVGGGPSEGIVVPRTAGATIVLPTEDEWYKAAYYNPLSSSYFDYPTGSDTQPTCAAPTATPNSANCSFPFSLTSVGSYPGSASPYGTFDQAGNVSEWTETFFDLIEDVRIARGGDTGDASVFRRVFSANSLLQHSRYGFRLVLIPEPSTALLVIAGLLGIASGRRLRFASRSI